MGHSGGMAQTRAPTLSYISYMCDTKQTGLPVIVYILMVCTFGGVSNMAEHYSIFKLRSTLGPIANGNSLLASILLRTNPSPSLPVHVAVVCHLTP
jgi:hypothetical protein